METADGDGGAKSDAAIVSDQLKADSQVSRKVSISTVVYHYSCT